MATINQLDKTLVEYMQKFPSAENPTVNLYVVGVDEMLELMQKAIAKGYPLRFEQIDEFTLDGYRAFIGDEEQN